ncbi:hypothetical protein XaclCFBP3371_20745 [Xanthomonas euvesicatoria pv. citrumelonis]|nr:hypothetical protein XaclCFBP3371_20745 [Xanthomonas euvesicatoria pv. citrumelonis]
MSTSHSPNGDGPNRGFFNSSNADFTRWNVVNNIFALLFVQLIEALAIALEGNALRLRELSQR